jgi:hypothetical protein
MSADEANRLRRQMIRGALIEAPSVLGGAVLAVVTGNPMWALGAAGLGTLVLFILIAQSKKEDAAGREERP